MVKTHIITFGTANFDLSLSIQAAGVKRFSQASHMIYRPDHPAIQGAQSENPELFAQKRGFGYWMWKPYIILDAMSRVPPGDHILYLDAGIAPVAQLDDWLSEIAGQDYAFFVSDANHPAAHYTKRDCFVELGCDSKDFHNTPMLSAGIQSYINNPKSGAFVEDLKNLMRKPGMIDDSPNLLSQENLPDFVEHRHDQSVLTLVTKKRGIEPFLEPTQYGSQKTGQAQLLDHHRMRKSRTGLRYQFWLWKRRRRMNRLGLKSI